MSHEATKKYLLEMLQMQQPALKSHPSGCGELRHRKSMVSIMADRDRAEVDRRVTLQKQQSLEMKQQQQQQQLKHARPAYRRAISEVGTASSLHAPGTRKRGPSPTSSPRLSQPPIPVSHDNGPAPTSALEQAPKNQAPKMNKDRDRDKEKVKDKDKDKDREVQVQAHPPQRQDGGVEHAPKRLHMRTHPAPLEVPRQQQHQQIPTSPLSAGPRKVATRDKKFSQKGSSSGRGRPGKSGKNELAGLLRRKEQELRKEGVSLVLHMYPPRAHEHDQVHLHDHQRRQGRHPLDTFSSITVDTHMTPHQHPHHSPHQLYPAEEQYVLGTELEEASRHDHHSCSHDRSDGRSRGRFKQSGLTVPAEAAPLPLLDMDISSLFKPNKGYTQAELCASISRHKKAKQANIQLQKKLQPVNLCQKSTLAKSVLPSDGVNLSTAISTNRKVKRDLLRKSAQSNKSSGKNGSDGGLYALPFILPRAERERQRELRESRINEAASNSSWNQFLHALRGGNSSSAAAPLVGKQSQQQPTQAEREDYTYFTRTELETAFNFIKIADSSVEGGGKKDKGRATAGARGVSAKAFNLACRQARAARKQLAGEEQSREVMRSLEGLLRRTGCSLSEWFRLCDTSQAQRGDGVLTHLEFVAAIRNTCERVGVIPFEHSDVMRMIKYMDPNADGDLSAAEMEAGFQRLHLPAEAATVISQAGPVLLYLLQCMQEQQKRAQDLFHSFVASGNGTTTDTSTNSKYMGLQQFCEGVDTLGLLVQPSAALLAEYGSLQQRRQAGMQAALLASRRRAARGGATQQTPRHAQDNSGGGEGGHPHSGRADEGGMVSAQKLIQYHLTHEEQHDVNNYRYFLMQQQSQQPHHSQQHFAGSPPHRSRGGGFSSIAKEDDQRGEEDRGASRMQVMRQQDEQLKQALQDTSHEMDQLTAALVEAQQSRAVVAAAGGRERRTHQRQEREKPVAPSVPPPSISVSVSSSPSPLNSRTKKAASSPTTFFSPLPPAGAAGTAGGVGHSRHRKRFLPESEGQGQR